jgi:HEAT repeat protein
MDSSPDYAKFLEANQPLPPDWEMTQAEMDAYKEGLFAFRSEPSPQLAKLLMNSFGDGDGAGMYQTALWFLSEFDYKDRVQDIRNALNSRHESVRYWCCQLAQDIPHPSLLLILVQLATNDQERGLREMAILAIEMQDSEPARTAYRRIRENEKDPDVLEFMTSGNQHGPGYA